MALGLTERIRPPHALAQISSPDSPPSPPVNTIHLRYQPPINLSAAPNPYPPQWEPKISSRKIPHLLRKNSHGFEGTQSSSARCAVAGLLLAMVLKGRPPPSPLPLRRLTISSDLVSNQQPRFLQTRNHLQPRRRPGPKKNFRDFHLQRRSVAGFSSAAFPPSPAPSPSLSPTPPPPTPSSFLIPLLPSASCRPPRPPSSSTSVRSYCSQHSHRHPADLEEDEDKEDLRTMPSDSSSDAYTKAFNNNSLWRRSLAETEPELFESMAKGQSPQILWIGCADSRCPETTILGLKPGEIFCHRNIANILVNTDINSLSVIQYAVQYLKVKHIIICGHTSCGGIAAALGNKKLGLIDTWLMPLRAIRQENLPLLNSLDETQRGLKMVELNVRAGVKVLLANPIVLDAMDERGLQVHALIYNVGTGELRELDIEEDEEVVKSRVTAFKTED
ncbi:uncharacterized protein PV07_09240 [Cladophialophora immunda]|uniref:Carbonic anhydrase n=1 Tax=Cladophialophora immunda TaxID=569365 RepID=A0A0D2C4M0_9EURO|nr:uncharacterized protein PV07_09240 [Cladophialophora immunda]KIW26113.1 hypothetical protein PV07_09240 [Cladophialophora immunda]